MRIKCLVVDNNPVLLRAISALLTKEGCDVRSAQTGLNALEILEDFKADIVFTDLVMPLISGEQLCRLLRSSEEHSRVYIVVISAIILEDFDRIQKNVDCDLCIAKGSLGDLRQHLKDALAAYLSAKEFVITHRKNQPIIPKSLQRSDVTSELLAGKQHLKTILDNIVDGIIEMTQDGVVVGANNASLEILGYKEGDLAGKTIENAVDWGVNKSDIRAWKEKELVGKGGNTFSVLEDCPLQFQQKMVTVTLLPVLEQGKSFGLCILRDISRQHYAEKHSRELDNAIKLVKKMDALSCMAGGLAHDFNNLLTVICGNLDILSLYGDRQTPSKNDELVAQTRKSAQIAVDLTRQISCFSNFGIVSREICNFKQLVEGVIGKFRADVAGKYQIYNSYEGELEIEVDAEEIGRAISNVLLNAIEAAPGKKVRILTDKVHLESAELMSGQYVPAGIYAKIEIIDTGGGIDPESLVRVFDPYYSTKTRGINKGMGLGLTIVYATMRNHGGYVIIESSQRENIGERESGTNVSFFLPAKEVVEAGQFGGKLSPGNPLLLLEPDSQMRNIGKIMLSYLGFNVILARSQQDATRVLKNRQEGGGAEIVLAIVDGADDCAKAIVRELEVFSPRVKVIAMGRTALDPIVDHAKEYGFVNSMTKPYTMDTLKHVIQSALKK